VTRWVFEKFAQNVAQPVFCQNECMHIFHRGKKWPKLLATSVNKKNCSKSIQQSPKLVTLPVTEDFKKSTKEMASAIKIF
jgi:hypothetical protein